MYYKFAELVGAERQNGRLFGKVLPKRPALQEDDVF